MGSWDTIRSTVANEFSDLGGLAEVTQLLVRLLVAAFLGGLLGLERELQGKAAGIRTHMLVGASSALIIVVPLQMGMEGEALSRVLQGLLAGIGFLCAGAILKLEREEQVHGLTTAASVWMTAAIGIAAGLGRETTAALATVVVLFILWLERPLKRLGLSRPQKRQDD